MKFIAWDPATGQVVDTTVFSTLNEAHRAAAQSGKQGVRVDEVVPHGVAERDRKMIEALQTIAKSVVDTTTLMT